MKRGRGKWLAAGSVLVGIGTVVWVSWLFRDGLLEPWHLSRLRGGTPLEKEAAAIKLGELRCVDAAPLIVDEINAKGVWEQDHVEAFVADPYVGALLGIGAPGVSELFARGEHREIRFLMARWIGRMEAPDRARLVPALVRALGDEKRTVRGAAAEALVGLGRDALPAVPALGKALSDEKETVCLAALTTLASLGPWAAEAASDVATLVVRRGKGWETGVEILEAIGDRARDGVPELLRIFRSGSTHDRLRVIRILGELGPAAEPAAARLAEVLRDGKILVRSEIPGALEKIGPGAVAAVDILCEAMDDPRDDLTAGRALGRIGEKALPKILELLGSNDVRERRGAVAALRAMRDVPPDVVSEAIERLDDEKGRERAAGVLAASAQNDPAGLEKVLADGEVAPEETARRARELWFLALAESRDIDEQANACRELVALRSRAALPVIMKVLSSESSTNVEDRRRLLLSMIAIDLEETHEFLVAGFDRAGMLALVDLLAGGDAGEPGVRLLGRLLSSTSGEVIRHCCRALETFKEGVPLIVNEAFAAHARERGSMAGHSLFRLLVGIGSEDFSAIAGGLDHKIQYAHKSSVHVLRRLSSTQQLEASPEQLQSYYERASSLEDADVKAALLLLRADMAKEDAERRRILLAGLRSHSKKVRRAAALALGRLGTRARTCVPALEELLEDDKASVRVAARSALDRISASPGTAGQ